MSVEVAVQNRQTEVAECGLASVAIAAGLAGSNIDLAWLRQRFPGSVRGMTFKDIASVAGSIGFTTRAVACELEELGELSRPAILHWGLNHFVVLDKAGRDKVRILDPARGARTVTLKEASQAFTGVAMELTPSPSFQRRVEQSPLKLSSLLRWTPAVRGGLVQALLLSLMLQAYVLASPFYLQLAIDEAALKGDLDLLATLAVGFGLFAVFNAVAEALRGVVLQRLTALLSWDMTQRFFHHMIRLPLPWFQRRRLSDALTRFQSLDPLKTLIATGLVGAVIDGILSLATLTMMLVFAPMLAAVTLVGLTLYLAIRLGGIPLTIRLGAESLQASIAEQGKRMETLRAMQTIKVMGGETQREGDWANKFAAMIRANQASALANMGFATIQRLFDALTNIVIVYLGVMAILKGQMTVGLLYAFLSYRTQFLARAASLLEQFIGWRMLDIYTFRLADVVLTPTEPNIDAALAGLPEIRGEIELDRVTFAYGPRDPLVLKELSLKIEPGEFVAIVGPSGVGKSTLLKVMCGLYQPTSGEVRLDGLPLTAWGPRGVRSRLGAVMQDDELLPGSIADNVAFFDEMIDIDRVWECLRLAAVDEEVRAMPMRADSLVGDMGSSLSGGQRQRVLMARALYKQPRLLVLDEATSHLNIEKEALINERLLALPITRVVVAHRPETIRAATRVIEMN
jgi:ATP-binding cassette subfamily B protein RaxB